ncbi:SDR family NAD(P)-dependent oxidoreductase [Microvirgula aerodenitrificans]|uniref:SDR family NAD(P)-dependent oxidoreductase n=1 Tax=Microvirgula aerodenitrificans TaxID=57480 RepID=UPI0004921AF6|nr:SDR family NAD(P)-dependent oxidoreductase [Microvirgula aerodenitrificans]
METRSILITGCSSGIGLATATLLHRQGWRVFAAARRQQDVDTLLASFPDALWLDVDDSDSIHAAVTHIEKETGGRLDALFNNAGFGQPGAVEDVPRAALRAQFETNLFGAWELTAAVLPLMRRQGRGRILFNSSVLGFAAMRWRGAYNASKFAMEGLADTLRLELDGSGIGVSLVEPGPIVSRFRPNALVRLHANIDMEHSAHAARYRQELARLGKPDASSRMTLPAEAVAAVVARSLESRRPRARYRVTFPTHLFWFLWHLLPQRWLDRVLIAAA